MVYGVYKTGPTSGYTDVWAATEAEALRQVSGSPYSIHYVFVEAASPEEALQKAGVVRD